MNLNKWTEKALVKVAKMSNAQKIAMLHAIDLTIYLETGHEVIHSDITFDVLEPIAKTYGLELVVDGEDE